MHTDILCMQLGSLFSFLVDCYYYFFVCLLFVSNSKFLITGLLMDFLFLSVVYALNIIFISVGLVLQEEEQKDK